jgi:hypothetical protein
MRIRPTKLLADVTAIKAVPWEEERPRNVACAIN